VFIIGMALASSNNKDLKVVGTMMMMAAMMVGTGTEPGLLVKALGSKAGAAFVSATVANTVAYGPEAGIKAGMFAAAFSFVGGNGMFGQIGNDLAIERIIAHAVLGCAQAATSGGKCGPGAAAAAFGKTASGLTGGVDSIPAQFAITTVVGGTASMLGGGKFANGAAQAAFGYLFNSLSERLKIVGGTPSQQAQVRASVLAIDETAAGKALDAAISPGGHHGPYSAGCPAKC
jgi:hypothetical protein